MATENGLVTWDDVADAAKVVEAFVTHEGLDPTKDEDNQRLWEMCGMSDDGFPEYLMQEISRARQRITEIVSTEHEPETGLVLLALAMVSSHLSGVTIGAAATRQITLSNAAKDGEQ